MKAAGVWLKRNGLVLTIKDYICPGGKVEAGETLEECAIRECLEESGYLVTLTGRKVWHIDENGTEFHLFEADRIDSVRFDGEFLPKWVAPWDLNLRYGIFKKATHAFN